jgi:hypothetical protein
VLKLAKLLRARKIRQTLREAKAQARAKSPLLGAAAGLQRSPPPPTADLLDEAFAHVDADHSQTLSADELQIALGSHGVFMSRAEILYYAGMMDEKGVTQADESTTISLDEFRGFFSRPDEGVGAVLACVRMWRRLTLRIGQQVMNCLGLSFEGVGLNDTVG